ncbi:MAG TPA: hypothetical protein PLF13_07250 [candidate division Zixibacteria bacterium]|nr:hypothetical protein [candidate division Zixibacteria bacterium]
MCYGKRRLSLVSLDNEVILDRVCESSEGETSLDFTVSLDLETGEFRYVDSAVSLANCGASALSPDGSTLALLSDKVLYIVKREWK